MTESASSENNTETLNKKLKEAQEAHHTLELHYKQETAALYKLINKLSLACKGQHIELDNKLANLRVQLADNVGIDKLSPLLTNIDQLLNQQITHLQKQLSTTRTTFIASGKRLQQRKGLPPSLRRELRKLLDDDSKKEQSLYGFLPLLQALVELYNKAEIAANESGDSAENKRSFSLELHDDLLSLMTAIDFSDAEKLSFKQLRKRLGEATAANELLACSVELIKLLIQNVHQERRSSESFLNTLNEALSIVHGAVTQSLENASLITEQNRQLNSTLSTGITSLDAEVNAAKDLDLLKVKVRAHLLEITDALSKRDALASEELSLTESLELMQRRINALEKNAQSYRDQLSEQRQKVYLDSLTQLPNRLACDERINIEYQRWQRYGCDLSIAILDLDHFKQINDNYGHSAGDKTLQVVAQLLGKSLRKCDFIGRFGGEEFFAILPESRAELAIKPLNKLRLAISKLPFKFKGQNVNVTVSIGLTSFQSGEDIATVFERADEALYQAKEAGRNQVCIK
jgi:diguanylate cyclase (GGDEF)-like protein